MTNEIEQAKTETQWKIAGGVIWGVIILTVGVLIGIYIPPSTKNKR